VTLRAFDLTGVTPAAGVVQVLRSVDAPVASVSHLVISPDGRWAVALFPANASTAGRRTTWSTLQRRVHIIAWSLGATSPPVSATLDGKPVGVGFLSGRLAVAQQDGFVRVLDPASLQLELTLALVGDSDWVALTPAGHFDGTRAGRSALHWVIQGEPVALEQLADRFYEPHLVDKVLGLLPERLRDVGALSSVRLFPAVEILAPDTARSRFGVRLRDRGGGLGRVQVFVNGKELLEDARPRGGGDHFEVDLSTASLLANGENVVRVVPWNADGTLAGRGFSVRLPHASRPAQPAQLIAIVAGVSDYAAPELSLRFAAKDAADFGKALRIAAGGLFGPERVDVRVLAGSGRGGRTSKAEVRRAFEDAARRARPEDLLVVYLSGHGVTYRDGREDYAWLTEDAGSTDLVDGDKRAAWAVTGEELTAWTKAIPATKQVLVLDTCAAGALQARLTQQRSVPGDQLRAIERLSSRTGYFVLMGSASDAVSYEASRYAQGVLTYALLEGMRGPGLLQDGQVDVSRLFQYAADEVPRLAKDLGGVQQPRVSSPSGTSFPIGLLVPEARARIPLANPRPLLVRPVLVDDSEGDDVLDLSSRLARALRRASDAAATPDSRAPVYVDGDGLPEAVRVGGKYRTKGDAVSLKLVLRRDGKVIANLPVRGSRLAPDALADLAAAAVLGFMKSGGD
jgi:hypothetical protein